MEISKFFSGLFAVLGTVLLIGTVVLCLISLNAEPKLLETPEEAKTVACAMLDALCQGDYAAAGAYLYGQPDLGADREPADEAGTLIWEAFTDSLSYQLARKPQAADSGISWTATVDMLDIPAVTASLEARARELLEQRAKEAEDPAEIYDENNDYREEVVEAVLLEAVEQALNEDAVTTSREVTLSLIYRDEQWWVVPDAALLQVLSGGVA